VIEYFIETKSWKKKLEGLKWNVDIFIWIKNIFNPLAYNSFAPQSLMFNLRVLLTSALRAMFKDSIKVNFAWNTSCSFGQCNDYTTFNTNLLLLVL